MQIIIFTIGSKYYGINTGLVDEIINKAKPKTVPNAPDWVDGLINLRGNVVPTVNLAKLLRQDDDLCYNNIIIVNNEDERIGIMIKDVIEVIDIEDENIENVNLDVDLAIIGITRINGKLVNIIDMDLLLSKNEG